MKGRKALLILGCIAVCILLLTGHIRRHIERFDVGRCYVSHRPDLSVGCESDNECPDWAKDHASDFLDGNGVPLSRVKDLNIAIMQYVLTPSPDTIVIRCTVTPKQLTTLFQGKTRVTIPFNNIVRHYKPSVLVFPFKSLSWWPPEKSVRSRLKIYSANRCYIFVDQQTGTVWILGDASRGR